MQKHIPVMLKEVVDALSPKENGIYIDGTFGCGGYSKAILEAAPCSVLGIDRDPEAVKIGEELENEYKDRFSIIHGCFGDLAEHLQDKGISSVDGIALDIGVSSPQIDDSERGFSFSKDGPLDMRMGKDGVTAADVVNNMDEKDLADVIYKYGEERKSRHVAHAIVMARKQQPITGTVQLAEIVRTAVRKSKDGIDPATRTFQALRIYINDELGELERGLDGAEKMLADGGKLAVVSFHSLEDRIVKNFIKRQSGNTPQPSRHIPISREEEAPSFKVITRKPIKPSEQEMEANPRSRSAKLRVAEKIGLDNKQFIS